MDKLSVKTYNINLTMTHNELVRMFRMLANDFSAGGYFPHIETGKFEIPELTMKIWLQLDSEERKIILLNVFKSDFFGNWGESSIDDFLHFLGVPESEKIILVPLIYQSGSGIYRV